MPLLLLQFSSCAPHPHEFEEHLREIEINCSQVASVIHQI